MADDIELSGSVVQRLFGEGSKSEHDAIMLESEQGAFVLRRREGNAFSDPELQALVGRKICGRGVLRGHTFIMSRFEEL
jgi:hypothetical protein